MTSSVLRSHSLAVLFIFIFLIFFSQSNWSALKASRYSSTRNIRFFTNGTDRSEKTIKEAISEEQKQIPVVSHIESTELPPVYSQHDEPSSVCENHFGIAFLEHINSSATSYCTEASLARATCFHVETEKDRADSLCMAGPVSFDAGREKFLLECKEEGGRSFGSLGRYWYETGPGVIFNEFVDLVDAPPKTNFTHQTTEPEILLLVKREGSDNLWHSLMEIFAATMTLDTLAMAREPRDGRPLLPDSEALSRVRVVILDSHEDGPFLELWSHVSRLPLVRAKDIRPEMVAGSQIVVPLAGGANPFWQGDWKVLPCTESALLDVFVHRIFKWLHLGSIGRRQTESPAADSPIRLTYIDRRGQRKLFDQDGHLDALRERFPDVRVEVVDFANMTFAEQVRVARDTDVLLGVHGAGLTHAMFMRAESAVVEIMPEQLNHKGFRNLAKLRGLHYYGTHGTEVTAGEDWHHADVDLDLGGYLHLVDAAIAGVANSGIRNNDIR